MKSRRSGEVCLESVGSAMKIFGVRSKNGKSPLDSSIGKTVGEAVLGKKGRTIGGNIGSAIGRNLFGTLSRRK